MDGKECLRRLREILDEETTGTWMDERTSYDFLWEAATQFAIQTKAIIKTHRFMTVNEQKEYILPHDFATIYNKDRNNRHFLIYNDGSTDTHIYYSDYEDIVFRNTIPVRDFDQGTFTKDTGNLGDTSQDFDDWETTGASGAAIAYVVEIFDIDGRRSLAYLGEATADANVRLLSGKTTTGSQGYVFGSATGTVQRYIIRAVSGQTIPDYFSLVNQYPLYPQITGSATSDGNASAGKSVLTDTSGVFLTTDYVSPGDIIHNTTDGSTGVVLKVTGATTLDVAMYGGTDNEWDTNDTYVIQPRARISMFFDPPPSTSRHMVSVDYIAKPDPVYWDYGMYPFNQTEMEAIIKYAAWLYKYRDAEPDFGDRLYVAFQMQLLEANAILNPYTKKRKWTVHKKARRQ